MKNSLLLKDDEKRQLIDLDTLLLQDDLVLARGLSKTQTQTNKHNKRAQTYTHIHTHTCTHSSCSLA